MRTSTAFYGWALLVTLCGVHSRQAFVALIPNGDGVGGITALGHTNEVGGGSLNVFGEAFDDAGREWTSELCQADSDSDGATNGQELGDPCCTWTSTGGFDSSASSMQNPTHPGEANSFTAAELAAMACGESDIGTVDAQSAASDTTDVSPSSIPDVDIGDTNGPGSDLPRLPKSPTLEIPPDSPSIASTSGSALAASPVLAAAAALTALAVMARP